MLLRYFEDVLSIKVQAFVDFRHQMIVKKGGFDNFQLAKMFLFFLQTREQKL